MSLQSSTERLVVYWQPLLQDCTIYCSEAYCCEHCDAKVKHRQLSDTLHIVSSRSQQHIVARL
eukprot:12769-Heterococcus_DN1.PRE.3